MTLKVKHCLRTGKALQYLLDNPEEVEGGEEYLENIISNEIGAFIDMYFCDLSWIDYYNMPLLDNVELHDENIRFEHILGYHLYHKIGEEIDGFTVVGTLPAYEEIEEQAENGQLAYYYDPSFFVVWAKNDIVDNNKIKEY